MRKIDDASFEEYVTWYLQRDFWKRGRADPPRTDDIDWCLREMYMEHHERMPPFFAHAKWIRAVISTLEETFGWLAPDYRWLKEEGLMPATGEGTIEVIARQAIAVDFFREARTLAPRSKSMYAYYRMLQDGQLRFSGINRIVIWRDPDRQAVILHDGIGRVLPMVVLALQGGRMLPIEAYYGE